MTKVLKLIDSIECTFGYKNIAIVDTERNYYCLFPERYKNILKSLVHDRVLAYQLDSKLLEFLRENEFILELEESDPLLKRIEESSELFEFQISKISNLVIELSEEVIPYLSSILEDTDKLLAKQFVFFIHNQNISFLSNLLKMFEGSIVINIDIYLSINEAISVSELNRLSRFQRLNELVVVDERKVLNIDEPPKFDISYESLNIKKCGMIKEDFLVSNKYAVIEAKSKNSCLFKKVSIDVNGNIKNCPSMKESFGNIRDTTLTEAIEKPGFKKYWNINKDQISVCKDCEFRYICTDCRAYVEDPEDTSGSEGTNLSKPLKCGYNPYTGEWNEWSVNPLKQKAIDFYGMREMVENEKK